VSALAGDSSESDAGADEDGSEGDRSDSQARLPVSISDDDDRMGAAGAADENGEFSVYDADSDASDSAVDTEADPEYLHAMARSLDPSSQIRSLGQRLLLRNQESKQGL